MRGGLRRKRHTIPLFFFCLPLRLGGNMEFRAACRRVRLWFFVLFAAPLRWKHEVFSFGKAFGASTVIHAQAGIQYFQCDSA